MSARQPQKVRAVPLCRGFFAVLIVWALSTAASCASRGSVVGEDTPRAEATEAEAKTREETRSETESRSESESVSNRESGSASESDTESEKAETPKASEPWKPPEPGEDRFDWIRLKSGEWLKGDITYMRNRKMEFDSDELDDLELDWKDVVEVRSPRMNTILLEGQVQKTGTLLIRDNVILLGGDEPQTYPRARLVSIVPGEERELDYWSGKISVGTTFRSGNTDQTDLTARGTLYRRTALTRTTLDYTGAITTIDGREEVNNHRALGQYSVYLTTDFYLIPLAIEYYKDRISNIRHRVTPGAGAGYWVMDTPEVDWNVDLLGGYRYTEFDKVQAGQDRTAGEAAGIAATRFDWEVTSSVDLILEYRVDVGLSHLADTNHHAVSTLSVDLTKTPDLDLDVSFIWDRVGQPQRDDDGNFPEKDDFRLVIGLGVDF